MNNPSSTNPPNDGDFASYVQDLQTPPGVASQRRPEVSESADHPALPREQSVEDVLLRGEEPTSEFVEEWNAIRSAPELSEEELARQALSAPGDDGDPTTPE